MDQESLTPSDLGKALRALRQVIPPRPCAFCYELFQPGVAWSRYCQRRECQLARERKNTAAYYERRKKKWPMLPKKRPLPPNWDEDPLAQELERIFRDSIEAER